MIHETALVHPEAKIHSSVEVGPFCIIGPNVKIGPSTRLLSHVVVEGWTEIGENNVIYPFCVLGAVPQDLKYKGEPTRLEIGNNNTIRESVTMNLGTVQGGGVTKVGNHNLIMAYSHLGHDCIIHNNCVLSNSAGLAGHVEIEDYAILSGMVGVSQFLRIGKNSYVVGKASLEKDVPPFSVVGRPCNLRGANIVGLRRRGYAGDVIQKINEALKLWARPEVQKDQCLLEIESQYGDVPEIKELIAFIRESKAGVVK